MPRSLLTSPSTPPKQRNAPAPSTAASPPPTSSTCCRSASTLAATLPSASGSASSRAWKTCAWPPGHTSRDQARVQARRGEYIDRNSITVTAYLDDWIESHAMEIKPRTLLDYRACIRLYVTPRIGHMPIQAVRPSTITRLYRDLLSS